MKTLAAIYDFSLFPYAFGDVLTWNVRTAMAAHEAGAKRCHLVVLADEKIPHCVFQTRPEADQYQLFLSELMPAFYSHPCAGSYSIFHDRTDFLAHIERLKASGDLPAEEHGEYVKAYQDTYSGPSSFAAVTKYFTDRVLKQTPINSFFKKHRFIPKIREVIGCRFDVDALIAAQGEGAVIVSTQFRFRNLDQAIPDSETFRNADSVAWEEFFIRAAEKHPEVKFVLLGRLQEKPLRILSLPNIIAPKALGLNLGHEISLLLRSDFFIGSSSGFAQLANFSDVPYAIVKMNQRACDAYDIPFGADRLPFASENQKLLYGDETPEMLMAALEEGISAREKREGNKGEQYRAAEKTTTSRFFLNSTHLQQENAKLMIPTLNRAIQSMICSKPEEALKDMKTLHRTLWMDMHGLKSSEIEGGSRPTIGIVMPNFNHGEHLKKAFFEMWFQTPRPDQFVVVDDGSTDNSRSLIKKWELESDANEAIYLSRNVGVNLAFAEAAQDVRTDYFCPRSVDDTFFPEYLGKISMVLGAHPDTGLVCFQALRHKVDTNQRFLGSQIANSVTSFGADEAEHALRHNYIWDPGIAWKTDEFRKLQGADWRMRWIQALHIADIIALRRGFCYIPEPLMEYNMREESYSAGGKDPLRHAEAFVASARDLASDDKADIFAKCVRSGFLGLRENAHIPIEAVLGAPWEDGTKPLLLILHGLLTFLDASHEAKKVPAEHSARQEIQRLVAWADSFSDEVDLAGVVGFLRKPLLKLSQDSPWLPHLVGFFANHYAKKGQHDKAFELLRKELRGAAPTKSAMRTFVLVAGKTESRKVRDEKWRRAIDILSDDVWFGMEYVQILVREDRIDEAKDLAALLVSRDSGKDVHQELAEYIPGYENPHASNLPVTRLDPSSIEVPAAPPVSTPNRAASAPPVAARTVPQPGEKADPSYRVLFMTEGWADHPGGSPTNSLHNLLGSFDASHLGTRENFFIEDVEDTNKVLLERCFASRPDLVVISVPTHHPKTPKLETYKRLHEAGFALAFIWWDAVNPFIMALADEVAPYCRVNLILDFNTFKRDERYVAVWTPQDPLIYRDPKLVRTIDVCFAGSMDGYADRQRFLQALKNEGIPVTQVGGQREQNLSVEDYAWHFQKAKISINFPMNRLGLFQTKGRTWEVAACGGALFEQDNPETRKWWTPWVDYVPFTNEQELVERVRDYLKHPEKLEVVSRNAKAKFDSLYNARAWWSTVFDACKLGGPRPAALAEAAVPEPKPGDFFSDQEVLNIEALAASYRSDPGDEAAREHLLTLRQGLASYLLECDAGDLSKLFTRDFGKVYRMLVASSLQNEPMTPDEKASFQAFSEGFRAAPAGDFDFRELLVYMLYRMAHAGSLPTALENVPAWFREDYLAYVLCSPQGMTEIGEADRYFEHLLQWVREVHGRIHREPTSEVTVLAATAFLSRLNLIPVYFTTADVRELMTLRARIMEFVMERSGAVFDAKFPARQVGRTKIQVGFLNAHFGSQTETYTTLPSTYLDRKKFEIHLFSLHEGQGPLIDHCSSISDSMVVLPASLPEQVAAIRAAGLDVLLIGTNVTAVTNPVAMLSLFRLAPIQIFTNSSPMTTGMRHADWYLSGKIQGFDGYSDQYTERLLLFDAPINCLDFTVDSQPPQTRFTREGLGIPEDAMVFVSGANFFKILPELQETWAKILKRVEGAKLLLHPFNPNWTNAYPVKQFERSMREVFRRHGIDETRLMVSTDLLPTRMDVRNLLAIGDVYLDSYPLSGSVSLVDPLEAGLPTVIWRGETFRSLLAASMVSDLGIPELIASDEAGYVDLAVRLATEAGYRHEIRDRIRDRMSKTPRFFDCAAYGQQVGKVLEDLVLAERKIEDVPDNKELLRRAKAALADGKSSETEDLCRLLLERAPETAGGWGLLSELARRSGDLNYAAELVDQALELEPQTAGFWSALGEIRCDQKDFDAALAAFQRAVELRPNFSSAWLGLAVAHDGRQEPALAEKAYTQALRHAKDRVETARIRVNFADFFRAKKRIKEGIKQLRKAVSEVPDSCEVMLLLGSFLQEGGELAEALSTFARVAKKFPNNGKCWLEWGKALLQLGKPDEAAEKMRRAVAAQPDDPVILFNLAYALQSISQRTEALQVYLEAERAGCDTADLHINIGVIFKDQERYMEAAQRFHKGFERNPESHAAMNNLGAVCINLGLTTEAIECFQHALRLNPTMWAPHNNLGHMLKISGKAAEGMAYYCKGLEIAPNYKEMMHNYLLCTLYQTNFSPQKIFEEHRKWGARLAANIKRLPRRHVRDGHPQGKLRIGYVSPDLCLHPVSFFVAALMGGHDRERFEVYAYSDVHKVDAVTERFRSMVDVWRDISEMQNKEAGELIQADEIDILVDLCGHTAHNRLEVLAAKPAPIIASYLGYPATTGMPGVDFRITDAAADPLGKTDAWHMEKLVRLDRCAWCFEPAATSPPVGPLPAEKNGFITFGCFNNLAKLNAPLYDSWVNILRQVPDSRLFLKAKTLIDPGICQEVNDYFTTRGIALDRLRVSGFEVSTASHLDRYNEVDIALDSFPYHGTTTTCEALWMGVPVMTRAGEAHLSRVGVSLLQAVGHPELVASSEEEYIRLAVELAQDTARLRAVRAELRGQFMASPLLDQAGFIRALEASYLTMLSLPAD
ncbi:MAG: tetratricopeptide repeat protein [Verrucomicrobiae bacterium]